MWPITVALGFVAGVLVLAAAWGWLGRARGASSTRTRPGDWSARSGEATASPTWLRLFASGAVIVFLAEASVNFLSSNSLSWGLAGNWAAGIVVGAVFVLGLWYAWTRFERADWRAFGLSVLLTQMVLWVLIVAALALTPANRPEDNFNILEAVLFATVGTIIWVPIFGLPLGAAVGLVVAGAKRALRKPRGVEVGVTA